MFQTDCVNCQSTLSFEARDAGELIQCEQCGQFFPLPSAAGTVATMGGGLRSLFGSDSEDRVVAVERRFRWNLPTVLLVVLIATSLVAIVFGNLSTKILVPLLALAAWNGYRMGATRVLATFAALAVATLAAGPVGGLLEGTFGSVFGTTGLVNRVVATGSVAVMALVASLVLFLWIGSRLVKKYDRWRPADRWAGALFGAAQGALLVCLAAWGVLVLDETARGRVAADQAVHAGQADASARSIIALADSVRGSMFGPLVQEYNPIAKLPMFAMPGKFLRVVNHPEALASFVEHPIVAELKQRPAVVSAMESLKQDPKVKELIDSGRTMNGSDLATILSSPATLKLVDESKLVAELGPIAHELEKALDDAVEVAEANPLPSNAAIGIPEGAVSYQIHPPIQPWELTAIPVKDAAGGKTEAADTEANDPPQPTRKRRPRAAGSFTSGTD